MTELQCINGPPFDMKNLEILAPGALLLDQIACCVPMKMCTFESMLPMAMEEPHMGLSWLVDEIGNPLDNDVVLLFELLQILSGE